MNEFSILCRVLGSLYYRQPQDPLLVPLFTLIREGKLAASWPLEQDELLERLQKLRRATAGRRLQCAVCW
jgi:TorA maturation chaperone TorD